MNPHDVSQPTAPAADNAAPPEQPNGNFDKYPTATSVADFAHNLAAVQARINNAALRAGRNPDDVRLIAVSKTTPEERIRNAVEAGAHLLGENKVQEAKRKWQNLQDLDIDWAVIGSLQTNKAKDVAEFAAEFHALDRLKLAETLNRRLGMLDRQLDVFVQVNTSAEESKFGLPPEETLAFLRQLPPFEHLRVRGLMTLAMFTSDLERVRECFVVLRELRDQAREENLIGPGELSMGMSGDFEVAIAEGATTVRVGQAIFGARATPDSFYWPPAK